MNKKSSPEKRRARLSRLRLAKFAWDSVAAHVSKDGFADLAARRFNADGKRRCICLIEAALAVLRIVDVSYGTIASANPGLDVFCVNAQGSERFPSLFSRIAMVLA